MARVFAEAGVRAAAAWGDTPEGERTSGRRDLSAARVNVIFPVYRFNEGIDVRAIDALLMLRATDRPLLFIEQREEVCERPMGGGVAGSNPRRALERAGAPL